MIYQGSKSKWASRIWGFMMQGLAEKGIFPPADTHFVEPMCGGCGMTAFVPFKNRIANDINSDIIAYHQRIVEDTSWLSEPDLLLVTKERYLDVKEHPEKYTPSYRGFVGIHYSWGASYFQGYAPAGTLEEVAQKAYNSALYDSEKLKGVIFSNKDYRDLYYPPKSLVYFDIPYRGTKGYKDHNGKDVKFDYDAFFDFAEYLDGEGHFVFFSEFDPELPKWVIRVGSFERPAKFGRKKNSVLFLPESNNVVENCA